MDSAAAESRSCGVKGSLSRSSCACVYHSVISGIFSAVVSVALVSMGKYLLNSTVVAALYSALSSLHDSTTPWHETPHEAVVSVRSKSARTSVDDAQWRSLYLSLRYWKSVVATLCDLSWCRRKRVVVRARAREEAAAVLSAAWSMRAAFAG